MPAAGSSQDQGQPGSRLSGCPKMHELLMFAHSDHLVEKSELRAMGGIFMGVVRSERVR